MVGGMVGNILFAPTIKGPRLTDLAVTASTYGQVIPELYGTMRLGGNMIWTAGIKEHKHKSGGKGGPKQVTYSYTASFAIAFCKGAVDGVHAHLGGWQAHCRQRSDQGENGTARSDSCSVRHSEPDEEEQGQVQIQVLRR
jgi:hypothetical protein